MPRLLGNIQSQPTSTMINCNITSSDSYRLLQRRHDMYRENAQGRGRRAYFKSRFPCSLAKKILTNAHPPS